ncbi:MAG TPA: glutathione peroxidase [Chitinophagaceae bacterium]
MTVRQKILRLVYPLWLLFSRLTGRHSGSKGNPRRQSPPVSFYSLSARLNNGAVLDFSTLRGRKVLVVNTASDCGFTPQYKGLQQLHERYGEKLVVIGFPSNDFKEQEKGDDVAIAEFCRVNFGVSFPLAAKSKVAGPDRNPVFRWLSDPSMNGWNEQQPSWNFSKYLVDANGVLLHYFDPGIEPTDERVVGMIG